MKIFYLGLVFLIGIYFNSEAQITISDYNRADSVANFNKLVYGANIDVHWVDSTNFFWYQLTTRKGIEYKLVDAAKQKSTILFNQEKLTQKLTEVSDEKVKPYTSYLKDLSVSKDLKELSFQFNHYHWKCNLKSYQLKKMNKVEAPEDATHWGSTDGMYDFDPITSPDSTTVAYIKNYNVFVKNINTKKENQLSFDGSIGEFYSGDLKWSPDSKKLAALRIRNNDKHYIHLIDSSPDDQLEPKLITREYLKPGDALPIAKPCLFHISDLKQIAINSQPFENQYSLEKVSWKPDSKSFTFEFNQRGHQVYQVVKVDAPTGHYEIVVDEKSNTFIDYSGKYFRKDIPKKDQIVWASERDGWNHLYLIDGNTGRVINQITKGEWVVRGVEYVDEDKGTIIFKGSGKNKGEDPYFIHYYKVKFDGSGLIDLTPEKLNHQAVFSSNFKWFTDTYSKVDVPPVSVLRSTSKATVMMPLEKADIKDLFAHGYRFPEVFVAKARDGKTDIWGNIYYPTNFDSTKVYPIIEYIYAGPQGAFAQKSFRSYHYAFSELAELGFIIVQMDGMGTSYRSKAFHDVCYKNLKDAGFPDRIKWIKAAAEKHPFMDTTRVGIFGGSAGGQNSTAAVLFHPEFYKAAVSSCGCHDNRMDKMWWNEQWMGFPIGEQYKACSNTVNAYRLQGNLMLILGELDDNVDPSSTMQLADALIKENKDFELVILPGFNHTLGGKYGERKRRNFFVKCFYKQLSPLNNKN